MQSSDERFERLISLLPVKWERVVGLGISYFIGEQDPEKVTLKVHADENDDVFGYSIQVRTDSDNVEEAVEFWEEFVEDKL